MMKYEIQPLTEEEEKYIAEKIDSYCNDLVKPDPSFPKEESLVFKVETEDGKFIAGCTVNIHAWGRAVLGMLWVDEKYRKQGLGSILIRRAEKEARDKGCYILCLGTLDFQARPLYEKHGFSVFTTFKDYPLGHENYSLSKRLDKVVPDYVPTNNAAAEQYEIKTGTEEDAAKIGKGLDAHAGKFVTDMHDDISVNLKLVDEGGKMIAGVVACVDGWNGAEIEYVWVEEPYRKQGLGTYLVREAEKRAKESGAYVIMATTGDWNVGFFKKVGFEPGGELKDFPQGHSAYELYKFI